MKKLYVNQNKKRKNTQKENNKFLFEKRLDEANKNSKIKSINDFDETNCNNIKSLAIKKILLLR